MICPVAVASDLSAFARAGGRQVDVRARECRSTCVRVSMRVRSLSRVVPGSSHAMGRGLCECDCAIRDRCGGGARNARRELTTVDRWIARRRRSSAPRPSAYRVRLMRSCHFAGSAGEGGGGVSAAHEAKQIGDVRPGVKVEGDPLRGTRAANGPRVPLDGPLVLPREADVHLRLGVKVSELPPFDDVRLVRAEPGSPPRDARKRVDPRIQEVAKRRRDSRPPSELPFDGPERGPRRRTFPSHG